MAGDRSARHVEADVPAAGATLLGRNQRQVDGISHEIGLQQEAHLLTFAAVVIRLAGKAILEIVRVTVHELDVLIEIDYRWRVRDRNIAHVFLTRAVEMLVPAIERDGENRACFPLEGGARACIVPHGGGSPTRQHQNHLLE